MQSTKSQALLTQNQVRQPKSTKKSTWSKGNDQKELDEIESIQRRLMIATVPLI
jgi:hypothetical protein